MLPGPAGPPGRRRGCAAPRRCRACRRRRASWPGGRQAHGLGWPADVIPVEHHQLARAVNEHVVGVQVAMAGDQRVARLRRDHRGDFAQQAGALGQGRGPWRPVRERRVSELVPDRRVWDGVVPGIGLAAGRQCAGVQPAQQAADAGGDARVGQVDRHAVNPPVEPQPAAAGIAGQPGDERPARPGHAGRQPDTGRFQVRGHLRLLASRFLTGLPEQLLDREAIRTQVKAPDLSHRTPTHRDDRGARYVREPEGSADPADCRPVSADHTLSQPAHTRPPPAHYLQPGPADRRMDVRWRGGRRQPSWPGARPSCR